MREEKRKKRAKEDEEMGKRERRAKEKGKESERDSQAKRKKRKKWPTHVTMFWETQKPNRQFVLQGQTVPHQVDR